MHLDCISGTRYLGNDRTAFSVWAPLASTLELRIIHPEERRVQLTRTPAGYFQSTVEAVAPGTLYVYRIDGEKDRPDPASRCQPQGVHGPSQVVESDFPWSDSCWFGLPLRDYIIYELHVGTFTQPGTFSAIIPHLPELKELGITAIELMPVAQFPGARNWGYDGVFPFAAQHSYGGPEELKRLVDACHSEGLAAILDVVYNHLGPEGNYLGDFGPYFTENYKTPWGRALNFDGSESDPVRRFFIDNALYWITDFHFDALRLDAVHAILDHSPYTFLEELGEAVRERAKKLNRQIFLFPESAANDARIIRSRELGGYGLDAQWNDDFHHALRGVLTEERSGYYEDYGEFHQLVKAYREGFVYSGQYSRHRRRRHGTATRNIPAERFVVFAQNHDQVGNRMLGERLSRLLSFEELKLAAGAVLLSPFLPLLFMGEEYGEEAPFLYFTSHHDPGLVEAVRRGRREEFAAFGWGAEPPDPQDEATFLRTKLNHQLRLEGHFQALLTFYRELIRLRKTLAPLARLSKEHCEVFGFESERALVLSRISEDQEVIVALNFNASRVSISLPLSPARWNRALDSTEGRWHGPGSNLPDSIETQGPLNLDLPASSVSVFARSEANSVK